MNLLIHEGKHEHRYILFQVGVDEGEAWLAMFRVFDEWECFYDGLEADDLAQDQLQIKWYIEAKKGNKECAKRLLLDRSGGEYESVYILGVQTPAELLRILDL